MVEKAVCKWTKNTYSKSLEMDSDISLFQFKSVLQNQSNITKVLILRFRFKWRNKKNTASTI